MSFNKQKRILTLATQIIRGVKVALMTRVGKDYQLLPWKNCANVLSNCVSAPPGNDPRDYNTGIAVYLRYALYVYNTNSTLKQYMNNIGVVAWVIKLGKEQISSDDHLCYPTDNPQCSDLVKYTNKLAILTAAIQMKKNTNKS